MRALLLAAAILVTGSPPAAAQLSPHQVEVASNYFSPSRVTIRSGETVRWIARNSGHTVEADDGRFRFPPTGTFAAGESAEFTFTSDNEWVRFRCTVHSEMRGTIKIGEPPPPVWDEPTEVRIVPSSEYPTIALALDGISEGGAVDLAPGSYEGPVVLDTQGVRLRGTGNAPSDVVLGGNGLYAVGVSGRASGVRVENLALQGFTVAGVVMLDADRFVVDGVHIDGALNGGRAGHGIRVRDSRYGRISNAVISGAETAGVTREDCSSCDLIVERSVLKNATVGLFARNAGSLIVRDSVLEANTTGIAVSGGEGGVHLIGNTIRENTAPYLRRPTVPTELAPQVGIWMDAARHVLVERNHVEGHRYGIAVTGVDGPSVSVRVRENAISGSSEADVAWDGIGIRTCFATNTGPDGTPPRSEPPMIETLYPCTEIATPGIPVPLVTAKVLGAMP